ncbi:hypothetical protein [Alkalicoccus chagannorensis]|uniref:hypothetical protein n=1 Tax=Alkalicoccus chagannorensis TaxID=427072 RepID=UPI00047993B0|nr:hypothetical protein [Alkalicoccus chagannorensis]
MYYLHRYIGLDEEILRHSGTWRPKLFATESEAAAFARCLNHSTIQRRQWDVQCEERIENSRTGS